MNILSIDPGLSESAACLLVEGKPRGTWYLPNNDLLAIDAWRHCQVVAVEYIEPRGQAVGADTFRTQFWAGRYYQHALTFGALAMELTRKDIKAEICGSISVNDSHVRQGVIDHYGGDAKALKGVRCLKCKGKGWTGRERQPCDCEGGWSILPGPLAGISGNDIWAAVAVAVTAEMVLARRSQPPRSEQRQKESA